MFESQYAARAPRPLARRRRLGTFIADSLIRTSSLKSGHFLTSFSLDILHLTNAQLFAVYTDINLILLSYCHHIKPFNLKGFLMTIGQKDQNTADIRKSLDIQLSDLSMSSSIMPSLMEVASEEVVTSSSTSASSSSSPISCSSMATASSAEPCRAASLAICSPP